MRTLAEAMGEFMELQIAQLKLGTDVAHGWRMLQVWDDGMERSKHNRDQHNGRFDIEFSLKCQGEYQAKAGALQKRFDANQARLKELKDEVVALMTSAPLGGVTKN